jgi:uncharacterized protein DUF3617
MMRHLFPAVLTILALAGTACIGTAVAAEMKPGKWQISTEGVMDMGGKQTPLPKNQIESCVTPEQAKKAAEESVAPKMPGCKTEFLWRTGNQAQIRATCDNLVSTSTITSTGDTYTAVTHIEGDQGNMKMITDMTVTGKRVGECTQ